MLSFQEFRRIRKTYIDCETKVECRKKYQLYVKQEKDKMNSASTPIANTFHSGWSICEGQTLTVTTPYMSSLGTIDVAQPAPCKKAFSFGCKQEEGNNPMNYATATVQAGTTETQDQRKYLSNRLEEIYWDLLRPLEAKFGLTDDERPMTPKELKKRIADGLFVIKGIKDSVDEDDEEDDYFYGSWANMIRWRDPAKKADHDGYVAARKELQDLRQKTLDIIKIDEPKSGLDAIKALEAWEPTGAAN